MLLQSASIALVAATTGFTGWAAAAVLMGAGTAMVYPTLLAAIGDVAHPQWRASAVGIYRLWRDGGFAVGALLAGVLADLFGLTTAIWAVAALTAASGVIVAVRMYETHGRRSLAPLTSVVYAYRLQTYGDGNLVCSVTRPGARSSSCGPAPEFGGRAGRAAAGQPAGGLAASARTPGRWPRGQPGRAPPSTG
jgi:MFS family permease